MLWDSIPDFDKILHKTAMRAGTLLLSTALYFTTSRRTRANTVNGHKHIYKTSIMRAESGLKGGGVLKLYMGIQAPNFHILGVTYTFL
jgi:hypothetical protein